ncbi:MAG: 30S ribosomal protein S5 [Candidatus Micrarchaeia archaeon]|jgi:small subunit ribosomal protein S5
MEWQPKTEIGRKVKNGEIKSIDEILDSGKRIKEVEIVDFLLPNLKNEIIETRSVQRMSDNGRKRKWRVVVAVGDENGHVGVGIGKNEEKRPAIEAAIRNAKLNLIKVPLGCGAWGCNCNEKHSIPIAIKKNLKSFELILKPAPRGVGISAGETVAKVLKLAGVKDVWSFSRGKRGNRMNSAIATYLALKEISSKKKSVVVS